MNTKADQWARRLVQRMFANRTGHGGTAGVTYLQMRPNQLHDVAQTAYEAGAAAPPSILPGLRRIRIGVLGGEPSARLCRLLDEVIAKAEGKR